MKIFAKEQLSPHKYKTPEGYLICTDAILARTGKQMYKKRDFFPDAADGDEDYEVDRLEADVFEDAAIASFENKPITVEHPDENVNSTNYKTYEVGYVRDVHKGEVKGQPVLLGNLVIRDEQTIKEIEAGEHTDLSCGYDCDVNDEEHPHQINIRGNHVALCKEGRAGIARIQDSKTVKDEVKSLEADIRAILSKYNEEKSSKITLFEVKPGTFIEHYDDGDIDFSKLEKHDEGKLRYSFSITGGLNGNGEWTDYLEDLKKKFEELESKTGLKVVIQDITNDVADDVWTAKVFMYKPTTDSTTKTVKYGFETVDRYNKFWDAVDGIKPDFTEKAIGRNEIEVSGPAGHEMWKRIDDLAKHLNMGIIDSKLGDVEPKEGEDKQSFISRFMGATKSEYPDRKQRLAVAYSYWNKHHDSCKDSIYGYTVSYTAGPGRTYYVADPKELIGQATKNPEAAHIFSTETEAKKAKRILESYLNSTTYVSIKPVQDSVNDTLVDEPKAWSEMKSLMQSKGYKLDKEGKTWTDRHHLEFDSSKQFDESTWRNEAGSIADLVDRVEAKYNTPSTYNIGFNPRTKLIHAVIDIDKKYVKDSLNVKKLVKISKIAKLSKK